MAAEGFLGVGGGYVLTARKEEKEEEEKKIKPDADEGTRLNGSRLLLYLEQWWH